MIEHRRDNDGTHIRILRPEDPRCGEPRELFSLLIKPPRDRWIGTAYDVVRPIHAFEADAVIALVKASFFSLETSGVV